MNWECCHCFTESDSKEFPEGWMRLEVVWTFKEKGVNKRFATHGYSVCGTGCQEKLAKQLTRFLTAGKET
jgi:hypothetical protein